MTHEEAAMRSVFDEYPLDFWRKQHVFKRSVNGLRPNAVHDAVARLSQFYNSTGKSAFVITQNIDGFDRACAQGGEVFEIHGNLDYMRCS